MLAEACCRSRCHMPARLIIETLKQMGSVNNGRTQLRSFTNRYSTGCHFTCKATCDRLAESGHLLLSWSEPAVILL